MSGRILASKLAYSVDTIPEQSASRVLVEKVCLEKLQNFRYFHAEKNFESDSLYMIPFQNGHSLQQMLALADEALVDPKLRA